MMEETRQARAERVRKSGQIATELNRAKFWTYCRRAAAAAKLRARGRCPVDIDAHDIDRLLVDQNWCCAVSGIRFEVPGATRSWTEPFGPSLDRIKPELGYTRGNVRVVCSMVNMAMGDWGLENLVILVKAMAPRLK